MNTMYDLFLKASQGKLTPADRADMQALSNDLEALRSWIKTGTSSQNFQAPNIGQPNWKFSPLHSIFIERLAATSIANDTPTYITFDRVVNFGNVWHVSGDKVYIDNADGQVFDIDGSVGWATNATGYRGCWIEGFDKNDVSLGTQAIHTFAGQALITNVLPLAGSFYFGGMAYIKFFVRHTAGAPLNMTSFIGTLALK